MFSFMRPSKDRSIAFSWFGMAGVAVFIIAWMCAAATDTAWQFGVDTLSEFGVSETDASLYFNYGCIITGILLAVFGAGIGLYSKHIGNCVGGTLLFAGGILFALVGVYTKDVGDLHAVVAIGGALCIFAGMISVTVANWVSGRKVFAGFGIVAACVVFFAAFALPLAGLEAYGILAGMIWILAECVNIILRRKN